jgi:hypothetical protein
MSFGRQNCGKGDRKLHKLRRTEISVMNSKTNRATTTRFIACCSRSVIPQFAPAHRIRLVIKQSSRLLPATSAARRSEAGSRPNANLQGDPNPRTTGPRRASTRSQERRRGRRCGAMRLGVIPSEIRGTRSAAMKLFQPQRPSDSPFSTFGSCTSAMDVAWNPRRRETSAGSRGFVWRKRVLRPGQR